MSRRIVVYFLVVLSFLCCSFFFFLMIRRPPRSTQGVSSAASDVYKRQVHGQRVKATTLRFKKSIILKTVRQSDKLPAISNRFLFRDSNTLCSLISRSNPTLGIKENSTEMQRKVPPFNSRSRTMKYSNTKSARIPNKHPDTELTLMAKRLTKFHLNINMEEGLAPSQQNVSSNCLQKDYQNNKQLFFSNS
eukprot:TRINITY_DN2136_c0_g2_i5.p2 TRINITY_DN2136_c0_g2~~TRINITY_DN2136_c0_g2_i5.p2  ORF type:complete len:191 (+),score=24.18 TRINITY_DN2136_c0_g2_i5:25-597(+)